MSDTREQTVVEKFRSDPVNNRLFLRESAILEATELICELMVKQGLKPRELARRMSVTTAVVTRLLDGPDDLTLAAVSDALHAMGCELRLSAVGANDPTIQTRRTP